VFLKALVLSNLDVAFRVCTAACRAIRASCRSRHAKTPLGRLLLANSITLTPGTITVEMRGEDVFVHWICMASEDSREATEAIVGGFERYLEVFCG
jgi:multicomponent Na+:H+ antiporter subunit E